MASSNQAASTRTQARNNTQAIVVTAMCIALTYIFTAVVNIRLPFAPNGGLIHLGNVPLFLAAIIFGKKTGALSGAFGMGLFDLFSGWTAWAPFTFVVVGLMGFSVGAITEKKKGFGWKVVAILVACVIKIVGYYIAEGIIYGNWITPASSIPGNLLQVGVAAVIVLIIAGQLQKLAERICWQEANSFRTRIWTVTSWNITMTPVNSTAVCYTPKTNL